MKDQRRMEEMREQSAEFPEGYGPSMSPDLIDGWREPVSKRLRFEILKRDGFTCQYCGARAPEAILNVDHIKPVALGGLTIASNLVTACQPCNSGKGAVPLESAGDA